MNRFFISFVMTIVFTATSLSAHHGTAISYDEDAAHISVKGTVAEFAFRNPHVTIRIDAVNENGEVVRWNFEHSPPRALAQEGYTANSLQPGQEVTVVASPSRAGNPVGLVVHVILADGTEILPR